MRYITKRDASHRLIKLQQIFVEILRENCKCTYAQQQIQIAWHINLYVKVHLLVSIQSHIIYIFMDPRLMTSLNLVWRNPPSAPATLVRHLLLPLGRPIHATQIQLIANFCILFDLAIPKSRVIDVTINFIYSRMLQAFIIIDSARSRRFG